MKGKALARALGSAPLSPFPLTRPPFPRTLSHTHTCSELGAGGGGAEGEMEGVD